MLRIATAGASLGFVADADFVSRRWTVSKSSHRDTPFPAHLTDRVLDQPASIHATSRTAHIADNMLELSV